MRPLKLADGVLAAAVLVTLGAMLAWLYWPAPPEPEPGYVPPRQRRAPTKPVKPAPRVPSVSISQPFDYGVTTLTLLNVAEQPEKLKARVRLALFAYVIAGTQAEAVSVSLLEDGLLAQLADDGKLPDAKPGDGIWSAYLDAPELPIATPIPVELEIYLASVKQPQASAWEIEIAPPEIYPIKFWREPAGPVKPGSLVTFFTEFNQDAHLAEITIGIGAPKRVTVLLDAAPGWKYHNGPHGKLYEGEWHWDGTLRLEPGVEHPVAVLVEIGRGGDEKCNAEFAADPVVIDAPQVAITGVRFDPPPPLKRDSAVQVIVSTDVPIQEGVLNARLSYNTPTILKSNGRQSTGELRCWWGPHEWVDTLPCQVSYSINGVILVEYETPVAIEPMPRPKIIACERTLDGPITEGDWLDFYVTLDQPVDFGGITVWTGHAQPVMLCQMSKHTVPGTGKPDGHWQGRMDWPANLPPGNWGPLQVRYAIEGPNGGRPLYATSFDAGDLIVNPRLPAPTKHH